MAAQKLPGKALRHLRALAHGDAAIISIGKNGITDALVAETEKALLAHELVKVRVQGEAPIERKSAAEELASRTSSTLAQVLGRTFLLYKRHPKKPKIELPKATKKKTSNPSE